jgi:hypothetical protein
MTRFILHRLPHAVENALDFGLKAGDASGSPELIHAVLARDQGRRQKR